MDKGIDKDPAWIKRHQNAVDDLQVRMDFQAEEHTKLKNEQDKLNTDLDNHVDRHITALVNAITNSHEGARACNLLRERWGLVANWQIGGLEEVSQMQTGRYVKMMAPRLAHHWYIEESNYEAV